MALIGNNNSSSIGLSSTSYKTASQNTRSDCIAISPKETSSNRSITSSSTSSWNTGTKGDEVAATRHLRGRHDTNPASVSKRHKPHRSYPDNHSSPIQGLGSLLIDSPRDLQPKFLRKKVGRDPGKLRTQHHAIWWTISKYKWLLHVMSSLVLPTEVRRT